jgi:hypothetical protein
VVNNKRTSIRTAAVGWRADQRAVNQLAVFLQRWTNAADVNGDRDL